MYYKWVSVFIMSGKMDSKHLWGLGEKSVTCSDGGFFSRQPIIGRSIKFASRKKEPLQKYSMKYPKQ